MKIAIIGNGSRGKKAGSLADGGRIKVALYLDVLKKEGHDVSLIDLEGWSKHPFQLIKQIKKGVKESGVILIMGGPRGSRVLIPLVNHFNKKENKRIIFSPLGIGTLVQLLRNKKENEVSDFIRYHQFQNTKDNRMKKELKKLSLIIPETEILAETYRKFYELDNCIAITNFRLMDETRLSIKEYEIKDSGPLKLIYISRVDEYKGILDLVETIEEINKENETPLFSLEIYGEMQLIPEKEVYVNSLKDFQISYRGVISREKVNETLQHFFMSVLPTKHYGEATPGSLVESLIAGVPVLVSSFSQADSLVRNNIDGVIFEIGNKKDLKEKLKEIHKNKDKIVKMRENAAESGKKFLYNQNRDIFLKSILG